MWLDCWLIFHKVLANNLQSPNSLIYKVLIGRYGKRKTIWTANTGSQPSYGWQSLLYGRDLLLQGLQHTIGNGLSTSLGDKWLPVDPPRAPGLLPYTNPTLPVRVLIDQPIQQWNTELLSDFIEHEDHHIIRKIFLPPWPRSDRLVWHHTTDGKYTVKSGYHLACSLTPEHTEYLAPLSSKPDLAKAIWTTDTSPRIQHFFWKILSEIIPVKSNLRRRHINVDPNCARCCNCEESSDHLFFLCPYAQAIWKRTGLPLGGLLDDRVSLDDKISFLFHLSRNENVERQLRILPFWILWRIWKSRNELLFTKQDISVETTYTRSFSDTSQWIAVDSYSYHVQRPQQFGRIRKSKWEPPARDWIKCNYDVSHHHGNSVSGMGWIIRNHQGQFLEAAMGKFEGRHTVEEAELTALIWSMQATAAMGYRKIVFEGDNYNIIKTITNDMLNFKLDNLIQTVLQWKREFEDVKFQHQRREANKCADILARKAVLSDQPWTLFNCCPSFLNNVVQTDLQN